MRRHNIQLFNQKAHILNLALPVLFLILFIFATLADFKLDQSPKTSYGFYILTEFLLFNTLHVYFTFLMLFLVPEYKSYTVELCKNKKFSFTFYLFVIVALAFILRHYLVSYTNNETETIHLHPLHPALVILYFFNLVVTHHGVSQNYGLSVLYTIKQEQNETEKKLFKKSLKIEKTIGYSIIVTQIFFSLAAAQKNANLIYAIILTELLFIFLLSALIFFALRKISYNLAYEKLIYLLRYVFYPLSLLSTLAILARAAIHGFEYYMITKYSFQQTKNVNKKFNLTELFFIAFISIAGILCISFVIIDRTYTAFSLGALPNIWITIGPTLLVLTQAFSYVHFLIDRYIFKFSNSLVQAHQGKLFLR